MNFKKLILESGVRMLNGGYTVETWGNISVRDPETGLVYITPSGMDYARLEENDVVVCKYDGTVVEGKRTPSVEKALHLGIYRSRPEVNAVIHTHPLHSTVFSCMGEDIPLIIDEAAQALGDVVRTAVYALPGSEELAEQCVKTLGSKANACLLKSHGAVCVGHTMDDAFKVVKVLEMTARIYYMIRSTGGRPDPISPENIEAMQDFVKHRYGQR